MSDPGDLIEFGGETFARSEHGIPLASLMRFAHVAKGGADSNDLDGLDALYRLLEKCIDPDDWGRFLDVAEKVNAKGDDLMMVVREVISRASKRPTGRPSDSSDGPASTAQNSESVADSSEHPSLRVIRNLEAQGRADKAEFVKLAMAASSA